MAKNTKQQMEMFDLGGLKDQGETIDRKSRNKVPVGSLQKEVRDDVPINISEGEFVLPADVVRYHGLEKIMNMRQNAKSGLKLMDKMGQMGNSDQATLPDDIPFQPQNYQEGGAIVTPQIQMPEIQLQNQVPGVNVAPPQQLGMRPSVYAQQQQPVKVTTPSSPTYSTFGAPQYTSPTSTAATPDYSKLVGASFGQLPKSETKRYFNKETGEELYIPFIDGKPVYPIPNGFVEQEEAKKEEEAKDPTRSRVETTKVVETGDDPQELDTPEYRVASTLRDEKGGPIADALNKITSFGPIKIALEKLGGTPMMSPGFDLAEGFETTEAAGQKANRDAMARGAGFNSYADMAANYGINPTFKIGTDKGDVSPVTGKTYNYAGQSESQDGSVAYSSFEDFANAMKASAATGWYGGTMTKAEIESYTKPGGKNYDPKWDRRKVDAYNKAIGKTYNKVTPEGSDSDGDKKPDTTPTGKFKGIEDDLVAAKKTKDLRETPKERIFGRSPGALSGKVDTPAKKEKDMLAIDPTKKTTSLKDYFEGLPKVEIAKPKPLAPLDKFTQAQEKFKRDIQKRAIERKISEDVKDTGRSPSTQLPSLPTTPRPGSGYSYDYYQSDDSDDGTDPGSSASTDMGFSTSQGGFIPKRKKKKSMKRGGLASRK